MPKANGGTRVGIETKLAEIRSKWREKAMFELLVGFRDDLFCPDPAYAHEVLRELRRAFDLEP